MEEIKKIIDNSRSELENFEIPFGHKERFFDKFESQNSRLLWKKRVKYLYAAAIIVLILTPLSTNFHGIFQNKNIDSTYYESLISEKNLILLEMSEGLDPINKAVVNSTLDQLVNEAIPFSNQIPENIPDKQMEEVLRSYYCPKIDGLERLSQYIKNIRKPKN